MTFRRTLTIGLLGLLLVCAVLLFAGCSDVPEDVARADACRTYQRNYEVMNRLERDSRMGVYLAARIAECKEDGFL